jgi:hypothetical protein
MAGSSITSWCSQWPSWYQVLPAMRTPSPVGWTTSLDETLSARATSRYTARTSPAISGLANLAATSIRLCHHHHLAHWPVGQTRRRPRTFPTIRGCWGLPPQFCYLEEPNSEVTIDICIRWNAPLVWVAGYLITLNDQGWAP